jgi:lycopene cyclase domain-containing protein
MNFGRYSYLVTILVCAGVPLLLEYVLVSGTVRYYRRLLALITLIMLVATWIWDSTALAWRTWSYSPERTLGISLGGVPIETYLTTLLVAPAVAIATLAWANFPLDPIIQGAPYGSTRNISS